MSKYYNFLLTLLISFFITGNLHGQFFSRVTNIGPIVSDSMLSSGASWNDFNNDGFLDLYALAENEKHLYLNNGDSTFSEIGGGHFLMNLGVSNLGLWGDYNNDGFLDMYLCQFVTTPGGNTVAPNFLYKNNGPPNFELTLVDIGNDLNASPSGSWVDYDQDGDLDLFSAGASISQGGSATVDLFYRNNGNDDFQRLTHLPLLQHRPGFGTHDVWIDYDDDGDQDLFVLNWQFPNELYKSMLMETGNPDHFEAVINSGLTNEVNQFDISSSWGDYDNDGDEDVYIAFTGNRVDRLYENNGDGTFTPVTNTPITADASSSTFGVWGDYDNDGDLDLFVARFAGNPTAPALYRNEGSGQFQKMTVSDVGAILTGMPTPQGGNWGDYDNDGDLDLYVLTYALPPQPNGTPQPNYLIRNNQGNANHWLKVKCQGVLSNSSGMGAKISLVATIAGNAVRQKRTISGGATSFVFQGEQSAHFGLGNAQTVDSLIIEWPSGIVQTLANVSVDQHLTVLEDIPAGFLRANFYADETIALDTTALSVQFNDVSLFDPNSPPISWEWDFDNDGTIDASGPNPSWEFFTENGGKFSVKLTVSNGVESDTLLREDYIVISGALPNLVVDTGTLDLGSIPGNLATFDTTFYVYNTAPGADSVFINISDYFNADSAAISVAPAAAHIAGNDSLGITFTIRPKLLAPLFYLPQIRIEAQRNPGVKIFEKRFRFTISPVNDLGDPSDEMPYKFELQQNYPNPFNPLTHFGFSIANFGFVELVIYDVLGREIAVLVNENLQPGAYETYWDGRNDNGAPVASGVYLYQLTAGNLLESRKMLLLR